MAAYIISDVAIKDGAAIDIYGQRAAASIAQYGGRYIVRGGEVEVLEGAWRPRAIIIAEFPDMERARTWYRSAEYASALALRDEALSRNLILVDGVAPPLVAGWCARTIRRCAGLFARRSGKIS
jgi:uncharacterized protein (DUF1330 family)